MNKVIIRTEKAGVFYGELVKRTGQEVEMRNCRRLWYWEGAASLNQMAVEGVKNPIKCKFTIAVESIEIFGVIEILPCTKMAVKSIEGVKEWKI